MKRLLIFIAAIFFSLNSWSLAAENNRLRLALLPIPDVLPVFVAEELGYFEDAGVEVEVLPVGSGLQRDQLMQVGKVDGMLNELASVANFNRSGTAVQVVLTARKPYENEPLFRLLAAKDAKIDSAGKLAGVPIVISKNTIIDYVTERMLAEKGITGKNFATKSVASLPERYQLLLSGQVKAATLPEPLASSAIAAGAVEVINDTAIPTLSSSVMTFSVAAVTEKMAAVEGFVAAWNKAVVALNEDAEKYRPLMLKKIRVPKNVHESYQIPSYPLAEVPSEVQWNDTMEWMVTRGLLETPLSYSESINPTFQN